jgi:colicin import membrane protein
MNATADRLEFAPPPTPGLLRALGLAIIAHGFLAAALTWGVQWKQSPSTISAEAELWSAIPQQAAPPPPPPPPAPQPAAQKPPPPPPAAAQPKLPDPQIALEREKQRIQKEKQQAAEKLEQEKQRKAQEKQREQDQRLAAEKLKAEQDAKRKQAQEAQRKEDLKAQQEAARKLEEQRKANLQRIAGLAGSSGTPASTGTAPQSSAPSAGYGSRLVARIRPNIVYTETLANNPEAVVEVRTSADGTIMSRKLAKSSGIPSWDDAVLRAIDKTAVLPRDLDGRVPPVLEISFRPRD